MKLHNEHKERRWRENFSFRSLRDIVGLSDRFFFLGWLLCKRPRLASGNDEISLCDGASSRCVRFSLLKMATHPAFFYYYIDSTHTVYKTPTRAESLMASSPSSALIYLRTLPKSIGKERDTRTETPEKKIHVLNGTLRKREREICQCWAVIPFAIAINNPREQNS